MFENDDPSVASSARAGAGHELLELQRLADQGDVRAVASRARMEEGRWSEVLRLRAVQLLGELPGAASTEALCSILREDASALIRACAVDALAKIGGSNVASQLRGALEDPPVVVRRAAALQLGRAQDGETKAKLGEWLRSGDVNERRAAYTALAYYGERQVQLQIEGFLSREPWWRRMLIWRDLRALRDNRTEN